MLTTNIISKIFLVSTIVFGISSLHAGIQNKTEIPDTITIHNSSDNFIEIDEHEVAPDQSYTFDTNQCGKCIIRTDEHSYIISYPTYNSRTASLQTHTAVSLDFQTIRWLAGDLKRYYPDGIDEISITNDTLTKIALVVALHKIRSAKMNVQSHETVSKVVANYGSTKDKSANNGAITITFSPDVTTKEYTFAFTRRLHNNQNANTTDWPSIHLCANTIKEFANGFKVR